MYDLKIFAKLANITPKKLSKTKPVKMQEKKITASEIQMQNARKHVHVTKERR